MQKIKSILGLSALTLLISCTQMKENIGIKKVSPDAFSVDRYAQELEVPPEFDAMPSSEKKKQADDAERKGLTSSEKEILEKSL